MIRRIGGWICIVASGIIVLVEAWTFGGLWVLGQEFDVVTISSFVLYLVVATALALVGRWLIRRQQSTSTNSWNGGKKDESDTRTTKIQ